MRRVRPTLRVMKSLPETPAILEVLSAIARAKSLASADESARILKRLDLYALDCDLLKDAQREIDSGTPSKHGEATKSFGATVVEARDRSGAGYRGAVVFDGHGDPWLVYAERHDRFHAHVAEVLKRGQREGAATPAYMPSRFEYSLREAEESRQALHDVQVDLVRVLCDGLRSTVRDAREVVLVSPAHPNGGQAGEALEFRLSVEVGDPADSVGEANWSFGVVSLTVAYSPRTRLMREQLISCGSVYLQPDSRYREQVHLPSGELRMDLTVTHAKFAQLLAGVEIDGSTVPPKMTRPNCLHWVDSLHHTEGFVLGRAIRSLCGAWFVPSEGENADLPACRLCESVKPLAQAFLDRVRLMHGTTGR